MASSTGTPDLSKTPAASNSAPSQIHGHMQYVKGVVEEKIGDLTGSQAYKESGVNDQQQARSEIRAAAAEHPSDSPLNSAQHTNPGMYDKVVGTAEEKIGSAVGCPGVQGYGKDHLGEEHRKNL
ncbi:hypothetical protein BJ508DRAFT_324925 [Ascobolus immersus RN42]|uniref:CsbD-like domain-containing protein n=1 Tax=Ascobolus immersus RN42 TaxID=1160509 RepID=A0A3N4IAD1_ASCIM|nr:hypothetical protein BJ508DRAFT_324925 [Ascobolus immersus RN42]